jgi:hypothetical protein
VSGARTHRRAQDRGIFVGEPDTASLSSSSRT